MRRHLQKGLSLIEVMVVICLMAIVLSFGMPISMSWYQHHLCTLMQEDIQEAIHQAIEEAMILGEPLRLMPLVDHQWSHGMTLIAEYDEKQENHHVWQWRDSGYRVSWHGFISKQYLRFLPDLSHSVLNGYFLIENRDHKGVRLVVNRLGRVRVEDLKGF